MKAFYSKLQGIITQTEYGHIPKSFLIFFLLLIFSSNAAFGQWTYLEPPDPYFGANYLATKGNELYLATNGDVFKSTDNGDSWLNLSNGFISDPANSNIFIDFAGNNIFVAPFILFVM